MRKWKRVARKGLVMGFICTMLTGCGEMEKQIQKYAENKEYCELDTSDVTKFTYKENEYTIMKETVEGTELGEWTGYIRQYAVADENGDILLQEAVEEVSAWTITKLGRLNSDSMYFIAFLNVYEDPGNGECVIVNVNGEYHKAIKTVSVKDTDMVFDFQVGGQSARKEFALNPENATQLLCDGTVYQVTSETVEEQQLGKNLDFLAQTITYDLETKLPLSNEDLKKMDWFGTSTHKREQRIYMDVCEIMGTDSEDAVAVKVDREYLVAKKQ